MSTQTLLTVREVAALARVHPNTVYAAVKNGQLRATRIVGSRRGRSLRFHPDEVERWLGR